MFVIKQNDTLPNLEAQLIDADGTPLNLELCGVWFRMVYGRQMMKVNRSATITDMANGKVKVEWQDGDTDTPGLYRAEFEIHMPDDKIITVPNDGYFLINIVQKLG